MKTETTNLSLKDVEFFNFPRARSGYPGLALGPTKNPLYLHHRYCTSYVCLRQYSKIY